ncbi:UxaA family hydrolase [Telmatospirillum siberiense]|uniref:Hydrolase n=1 Tax=Telmatospirillum siberiense TaxID=382514 RepID=A0A2N3Q0R4_9PROT|nr:UxaA family hydrolase [Telmatospirillum siberiense]PKU26181.1 hydrolase [Telmatospirillum siberiense]
MTAICFRIHPQDNVATLLSDAPPGDVPVWGGGEATTVRLTEAVELGHKVALADIPAGKTIVKFGVPIGTACRDIARGAWVHLHNCRSNFDTRSSTLDPHSGAATDMKYE